MLTATPHAEHLAVKVIRNRTCCARNACARTPAPRKTQRRPDGTPAKAQVADERTNTHLQSTRRRQASTLKNESEPQRPYPHNDLIREACAKESSMKRSSIEAQAKQRKTAYHHMRDDVHPLVCKLRRLPGLRAPASAGHEQTIRKHGIALLEMITCSRLCSEARSPRQSCTAYLGKAIRSHAIICKGRVPRTVHGNGSKIHTFRATCVTEAQQSTRPLATRTPGPPWLNGAAALRPSSISFAATSPHIGSHSKTLKQMSTGRRSHVGTELAENTHPRILEKTRQTRKHGEKDARAMDQYAAANQKTCKTHRARRSV